MNLRFLFSAWTAEKDTFFLPPWTFTDKNLSVLPRSDGSGLINRTRPQGQQQQRTQMENVSSLPLPPSSPFILFLHFESYSPGMSVREPLTLLLRLLQGEGGFITGTPRKSCYLWSGQAKNAPLNSFLLCVTRGN